jgi:diacylglycerol kinase (ATP)
VKLSPLAGRESVRHRSILPRFRDAFRGLLRCYREEPNLRFHIFAASVVAMAGVAVQLEGWETAYLTVTVTLVVLAEIVNTAVERVVDFAAAGRRHPLAGAAKEIAAGAVLLTAVHATCAALYLFVFRRGVLATVTATVTLLGRHPWWLALPLLAGLLALSANRRDH